MAHEINKPSVITWFIVYPDDEYFYHYGSTQPEQVTTTGLDSMETFIVEADYIARCGVLGINLEE